MLNKIFIDSNVWIYLFLQDNDEKYKAAEAYLKNNNADYLKDAQLGLTRLFTLRRWQAVLWMKHSKQMEGNAKHPIPK
jgi:predicted nucleic acid-binding protein